MRDGAGCIVAVEAKQQTNAQTGGGMGEVEKQTDGSATEDSSTYNTQNECGAGVVAKGQQALCLHFGAQSFLV